MRPSIGSSGLMSNSLRRRYSSVMALLYSESGCSVPGLSPVPGAWPPTMQLSRFLACPWSSGPGHTSVTPFSVSSLFTADLGRLPALPLGGGTVNGLLCQTDPLTASCSCVHVGDLPRRLRCHHHWPPKHWNFVFTVSITRFAWALHQTKLLSYLQNSYDDSSDRDLG